MASSTTDILIFVEDPGAVNSIVDLPDALAKRGLTATTIAAGHARPYLAQLGGHFDEVDDCEDAAQLLDAHGPCLVLAGTSENPDTLGLKLIAEARRRGTASVAIVDGPASAEYRFRGRGADPRGFAPDRLLVPDDLTRRRFLKIGFASDHVVDCGHPYYDRVRAAGHKLQRLGHNAVRARVFPDAPKNRPAVVFLAEVSEGLVPGTYQRGGDYTLAGRGSSDQRTLIVLEEVLDALAPIQPRPYVVVRLHPKNRESEFAAYRHEFDFISQGGAALETTFAADLVVGMTTVLLFEAAIIGQATLSVIPRPIEAEWLTGIGLGVIPAVHTRESLRDILPAAVADPARVMGTPAEKVIQFGALDRMADFLAGLVAGGSRS
jgi:hypothetical protein